ncbi:hypothetical protein [Microvirga aerophila]|uniref:Uncharacterized protein n=1 Tax=Microvirga aerophila TaxID=670291 RepID=A0A512C426_9HYPH|nr:hypothetical protein [Microvirga aerophila]GEO18970.1 hypothetical protein MAE02_66660 [Microvirga aerophila]
MLQTLTKGKLKAVLNRGREPREDTVFGALLGCTAYQDTQTSWSVVRILLGEVLSPWTEPPESLRVDLWQRRKLEDRFVEPDAVIDVMFKGGPLRLILEAKWDASFHEKQASRQWLCFSQNRINTLHVFIVRSAEQATRHWEDEDQSLDVDARFAGWKECRRLVTWNAVATRLQQTPYGLPSHIEHWRRDALRVLNMFGEKTFEGFDHLPAFDRPPAISPVKPAFFNSAAFEWPRVIIPATTTPAFFQVATQ